MGDYQIGDQAQNRSSWVWQILDQNRKPPAWRGNLTNAFLSNADLSAAFATRPIPDDSRAASASSISELWTRISAGSATRVTDRLDETRRS